MKRVVEVTYQELLDGDMLDTGQVVAYKSDAYLILRGAAGSERLIDGATARLMSFRVQREVPPPAGITVGSNGGEGYQITDEIGDKLDFCFIPGRRAFNMLSLSDDRGVIVTGEQLAWLADQLADRG